MKEMLSTKFEIWKHQIISLWLLVATPPAHFQTHSTQI